MVTIRSSEQRAGPTHHITSTSTSTTATTTMGLNVRVRTRTTSPSVSVLLTYMYVNRNNIKAKHQKPKFQQEAKQKFTERGRPANQRSPFNFSPFLNAYVVDFVLTTMERRRSPPT